MNYKIFLITILLLTFNFCLLAFGPTQSRAIDMSSQNYKIESGDFNMASGNKESANYKLTDIVGGPSSQEFNSKGYILKTGISYLSGNEAFTFSISATKIDFGDLSPNWPKVISSQIVIQNGLSNGYKLLVGEKGPLQTAGQAIIPDTKCDLPQSPCTAQQATTWTATSTYGFGFGIVGKTVSPDFKDASFFRPFADLGKGQLPALVMSGRRPKSSDQATINYKVNISATQPVGKYQNTISFLALPGY